MSQKFTYFPKNSSWRSKIIEYTSLLILSATFKWFGKRYVGIHCETLKVFYRLGFIQNKKEKKILQIYR